MRTRMPWLKLLIGTVLVSAACSVIVNPADHPELCTVDGPPCGNGLVCANVDGDWRCVPETTTSCLDNPTYCSTQDFVPPRPYCRGDGRCVECLASDHCEEGYYCLENWCRPGCDSEDRCAEGYRCIDNECTQPRDEVCDNLDNDFNGEIDDGLDGDGDGYSACPTAQRSGDCNDSSAAAYPGGSEICDGLDNDCDGNVDGEGLCAEDEVCAGIRGCITVGPDRCEDDDDCDPGTFCNDLTGECLPGADFGESCFTDSQCGTGFRCLDTTLLGRAGEHCTELCCGNDACPPNSICAENGSGLKVCAPMNWFDTETVSCEYLPPRLPMTHQCQTCARPAVGLWERCADQCCRDSDCDGGSCQFVAGVNPATGDRAGANVEMLVCDFWEEYYEFIGDTTRYVYDDCTTDETPGDSCVSGFVWTPGDLCYCTSPCCSDADCRTSGHPDARCVNALRQYSICYDPALLGSVIELGSGELGQQGCSDWYDCASGVCHPEGGYCTQMCCPGGSCPEGYDCRPARLGGTSANMCTKIDDGGGTHG